MTPVADKETKLLPYLFEHFPGYKRTKIKQFLTHGSVAVNGSVVTAFNHPLSPGDRVEIIPRVSSVRHRLQAQLEFAIVYEDEAIIVVDKPAGLLTMGTEKDKINTVYFDLTAYVRSQSREGLGRIFIIHRLDRDVSGLLVFAKHVSGKLALQSQWPQAVKKYYAIVEGVPKKPSALLESYLCEDKFRRVYSVKERSATSKHARTRYELLDSGSGHSLLDVTLLTGRKNQIRVHLAEMGHPIVGDAKYGSVSDGAGRLALHAYFLSFPHPVTGKIQTFKSPLPASLAKLVSHKISG